MFNQIIKLCSFVDNVDNWSAYLSVGTMIKSLIITYYTYK